MVVVIGAITAPPTTSRAIVANIRFDFGNWIRQRLKDLRNSKTAKDGSETTVVNVDAATYGTVDGETEAEVRIVATLATWILPKRE